MSKLNFALSECNNPYTNLATEWNILESNKADSICLFLWQNDRTVVIGNNQNPYLECDCTKMFNDGVNIARRRTGGGAVYHDLGNINFSFIANAKCYDVKKQLSVIQKALNAFGIESQISGRNDITVDGKKFSGNAFYQTKNNCLHHGTILIKTDAVAMSNYLTPRKEKLISKGVKSVGARIVNLSELNSNITAKTIIKPIREAFEEIYGCKAENLNYDINNIKISSLADKWQSEQYIFGKWKDFVSNIKGAFSWGLVDIELNINDGIIRGAKIASDSLYPQSITKAEELLCGMAFGEREEINCEDKIVQDIINLLRK
jgi:lipoate-protein ligase A